MVLGKLLIYASIYFGLFTSVFFLITFFENRKKLISPEVKRFAKVTVAVPMYNAANHLAKTVESLLKLDWPKDKLEVIIVDDGSRDNSYEMAKNYEKDRRVVVLRQKNRGKSSAVN